MLKIDLFNHFKDVLNEYADCITEVNILTDKYWIWCEYYDIVVDIDSDYIKISFQDRREWNIDLTEKGIIEASVLIGTLIGRVEYAD